MSESSSTTCAETGRTLATAEAARASEARFREIQAACDACELPELRTGDVIYVGSSIYLSHGRDDFCGGLAEVVGYSTDLVASTRRPLCASPRVPAPGTAG
jgi:hypothetical protein